MSYFVWDPSRLSVHVDSMDNEHIRLIELMNELYDLSEKNSSKEILAKALTDLVNFTVKHFNDEEKFFDSLNYQMADMHKAIHKDLLNKLGDHGKKFESTGKLSAEFFDFLKMWLNAHIAGIDMKYGDIAVKSKKTG